MKRSLCVVAGILALVGSARADMYEISGTVTNTEVDTATIQASGWLDRIVINQTDLYTTSTVVVATYDGTEAIDTLVSLSDWTANSITVRPRSLGTTSAGVALAAAATGTNDYTPGTVLVAPYERIMLGGTTQLKWTGGSKGSTTTYKVQVYYEPTKK